MKISVDQSCCPQVDYGGLLSEYCISAETACANGMLVLHRSFISPRATRQPDACLRPHRSTLSHEKSTLSLTQCDPLLW